MKHLIIILFFSNYLLSQTEIRGIYNHNESTFTIGDKIYQSSHFSKGYARITDSNSFGLMDSTGVIVIPVIYEYMGFLKDGLLVATKDKKNGYLDAKGKIIIPFIYDLADDFKNGFAIVQKNNKCGIIDKKGGKITDLIYEHIDKFDNDQSGLARVSRDKKWGFINKIGEEIIPCIYQNVNIFREGLALVTKVNGTTGFLDATGKVVIPFEEYIRVDNFKNGKAKVQKGNTIYFINKKGETVN
ncbi:WG repeat-containing protein [Flavobacterium sp.]|jgi:hypothetical protein|uniref:WG repeat-containing protein n=1 Tax=Flavobacterium sp. TaxID=239 RepID=UPI0037BFEC3F